MNFAPFVPTDSFTMANLNGKLLAIEEDISASVPSGIICMWSGTINAIPVGWALCDGSNGTPNLANKFILGTTTQSSIGAQGGEETHKLSVSEMPSHQHSILLTRGAGSSPIIGQCLYKENLNSIYSGDSATEYMSADLSMNATGGSEPHNNMPPYYTLAYIMKI